MTEESKQITAFMKRADTTGQWSLAWKLLGTIHPNESDILIQLEREFFLNRKEAQAMYDEVSTYEIENADCLDVD